MITLKQLMIKELSLAVFFGLLIGLGLTGTFYFLKQQNNSSENQILITSPTPLISNNSQVTPTSTSSNNTSSSVLNVTSHQNNDIVATSKITLKGQTNNANISIIITTLNKNYYTTTDTDGTFSQNIDLEPGLNDLKITSIDTKDQELHTELFITYSTVKLE